MSMSAEDNKSMAITIALLQVIYMTGIITNKNNVNRDYLTKF